MESKVLAAKDTDINVEYFNNIANCLFTLINVDEVCFIHVSLDTEDDKTSSLNDILDALNNIIDDTNGNVIVFFSESCRNPYSYQEEPLIQTWFDIRKQIEYYCNLKFLTERVDEEDDSFGITVFYTPLVLYSISDYYNNATAEHCSVIGVKITSGKTIWAVQFPVYYNTQNTLNAGCKAMLELLRIVKHYEQFYCALGEFNANIIKPTLSPEYEFKN